MTPRAAMGGLTSTPDEHTLIAASETGGLTVWDVSNPRKPRKTRDLPSPAANLSGWILSNEDKTVQAVDYSPGKIALVRWHLDTDRAAAAVCESAADRMTGTIWRKYFIDVPYQQPCT